MQLFHLDNNLFYIQWDELKISPAPELISQLRKVLRIKKWDHICVQNSNDSLTIRYKTEITNRTDKELTWKVISSQTFKSDWKDVSMLIALPNKREKAELIVQKLTEIWINQIWFWVSEHSIIRQRNEKKAERLGKISREAVEQSRWTSIPEIKFYDKIELKDFIKWKRIFLANMWWENLNHESEMNHICWVIGPEWWFSESDLSLFSEAKIVDLWQNVLRMETASIVLAWLLKNK